MKCKICSIKKGETQLVKLLIYEHEKYCPYCLAVYGLGQMAELIDFKISGLEAENKALKAMLKVKFGGKQ